MPGIGTHFVFATLQKDKAPCFVPFYLGAQGPDPFFFRAFWLNPFISRRFKMAMYGSYLHRIDSTDFFAKMVEFSKGDDELYSFCLGLLSHYCMDRNIHPYVYYRTGFDKDGHLKHGHAFDHLYLEALLDRHMLDAYGIEGYSHDFLKCPSSLLKKISKAYRYADPDNTARNCYLHSVKTYRLANRLLKSKRGIKRKMWKVFGKRSMLFAFSVPPDAKEADAIDVSNLSHHEWKNPDTLEAHHESVEELLKIAEDDFDKGIVIFDRLRRGEEGAVEELRVYVGGIEHSGTRIGENKKEFNQF